MKISNDQDWLSTAFWKSEGKKQRYCIDHQKTIAICSYIYIYECLVASYDAKVKLGRTSLATSQLLTIESTFLYLELSVYCTILLPFFVVVVFCAYWWLSTTGIVVFWYSSQMLTLFTLLPSFEINLKQKFFLSIFM